MLNGYFLRAREVTSSELDEGYQFAAYSPVDPFIALGMLRGKIREGLATRYLSREHGTLSLGHNKLKGRVGYEGIVVDGEFISRCAADRKVAVNTSTDHAFHCCAVA